MTFAAPWRGNFSTLFRPTREANELSAAIAWRRYGTAFFLEIWPLEPTLQSARSANDFAAIPVNVGVDFFSEAVDTILPHLLPFDVWAVSSEFDLDAKDEGAQKLISALPEGVLTLLAACINERQQHGVFELTEVLDLIQAADSELRRDSRMRQLRRLAVS